MRHIFEHVEGGPARLRRAVVGRRGGVGWGPGPGWGWGGGGLDRHRNTPSYISPTHYQNTYSHKQNIRVKNMAQKNVERSCSQRLQETAEMMGMSSNEALNILKWGGVVSDNCVELGDVSRVDCERAMEYLMRYE